MGGGEDLLYDGVEASFVGSCVHGIVQVRREEVGVGVVRGRHPNNVCPFVGKEDLAYMRNGRGGRRRGVNHQVDMICSIRGVPRENGLELGDAAGRRGEGTSEECSVISLGIC